MQRPQRMSHVARQASRDGYFAPESMMRRIGGSPLTLSLGAGPTILFSAAHPLIAVGVAAHSGYGGDLWKRWQRTAHALYLIAFGSKAEADAVVDEAHAGHRRVTGVTAEQLGPFPPGTRYDASDPALMVWTLAALTEVALAIYGRLVRRLPMGEQERYYRDMTTLGRLVGIPADVIPRTLSELRVYVRAQLEGPDITVTPVARELAAGILKAPLPLAFRWITPAHRLSCAGMIPGPLREQYGFSWSPAHKLALLLAASSLRLAAAPALATVTRIPQPVRPSARRR